MNIADMESVCRGEGRAVQKKDWFFVFFFFFCFFFVFLGCVRAFIGRFSFYFILFYFILFL